MKLDSMYQEVILDHYKHPHGRGLRDGDAEVHHVNPTCGDEITLRVRYEGDTLAEKFLIRWKGEADPRHVKAIDANWSSAAEHGMNASTFTARVITSTGADVGAAFSGAIGAMSGPLHGGARGQHARTGVRHRAGARPARDRKRAGPVER